MMRGFFAGVIAMEFVCNRGHCYGMFVFVGVVAMECLGKVKYGLFDKL